MTGVPPGPSPGGSGGSDLAALTHPFPTQDVVASTATATARQWRPLGHPWPSPRALSSPHQLRSSKKPDCAAGYRFPSANSGGPCDAINHRARLPAAPILCSLAQGTGPEASFRLSALLSAVSSLGPGLRLRLPRWRAAASPRPSSLSQGSTNW